MPSHQDRRRGGVLDTERPRPFQEPVRRRAVEVAGPPQAVGPREPGEQLEVHLPREPPERAVADLGRGAPHPRLQVVRDQAEHLAPHVVAVDGADVQPVEERGGGGHAHLLVVQRPDAAVQVRRGRRLAEVVADGAEHHRELPRARQIADPPPRLIDHEQGMDPDVAFRMPLRLLRAVDQRRQFREQPVDHPQIPREGEAERRPVGEQEQFFQLAPDPFGRQIVERDRAADGARRLVDLEFEARRELDGPQDAQAVVAEGRRIDHAQAPGAQIAAPPVGIEVLPPQRVPGDGVDGEVAAARGLRQRQRGVAGYREAAVAAARLRFGAGEGDVERTELEDREAGADAVDRTESRQHRLQLVRGQAVDFDVDVLRRDAQQLVADPAADQQRPPAGDAHRAGHAVGEFQLLRHLLRSGNRSRCSGTTDRAGCGRTRG